MSIQLKLKNVIILIAGMGTLAFTGCQNNQGFKTTPSGLQYKIIVDKAGDSIVPGDYMKISLKKVVGDTTILNTSHGSIGYRWVQLQKSLGQKYDVMEGLALLTKGDSAEFKLPVNGVKNRNRPSYVKAGDVLHYFVKVLDVKSKKEFASIMSQNEAKQNKIDGKIIQHYIDSIGVTPKISTQGVNVIVHKEGKGNNIKEGETVSIMYTGKTLSGKIFDSNQDTSFHHTDPLLFSLGKGRMIPGMESGLKLLKKGAEATLVIPSSLAYGAVGRLPEIKPNTILLFDVKVLNVK